MEDGIIRIINNPTIASAIVRVHVQATYVGAHLTHLNSSPLQHALNVSVGGTRSLWRVFAASGASPPPPVCFL